MTFDEFYDFHTEVPSLRPHLAEEFQFEEPDKKYPGVLFPNRGYIYINDWDPTEPKYCLEIGNWSRTSDDLRTLAAHLYVWQIEEGIIDA